MLLVFLFSAFHQAPLILNAFFGRMVRGGGGGGGGIHLLVPSSSCGFVLVSISRCFSLLSVLFRGSAHVTACGRVISHPTVNRW